MTDQTATTTRPALTRRALLRAGAVSVAALAAGPVWSRAVAAQPNLFGYKEVRSSNLSPFPKWTGTLDRYFKERKLEEGACDETSFNKCHLQDWKRFLATLEGRDRMAQLREVNAYMNRAPYIVDPINYGVPDYWATPRQFFIKDGDCEDYGIAKYLSMRALGMPTKPMRIVVLFDENLRLAHAVLAVYMDGTIWIADNQISQVIEHSRIRHYRPIYSVNENAWWMHKRA